MAVNLINSSDIEVTQTGENIQLSTTVDMQTLESNVGSLSDLDTTDKSSIVNAINEVNKKNFASATLTSNTAFTSGSNINFNSFSSTTTDITHSSGTITIGNNISKILISGNMSIHYSASTGKVYGFDLKKNNTSFTGTRCQKSLGQPIGCSVSSFLLDVTAGDTIVMNFATDSGSTTVNAGTFVTIEVIE